MSDKSVFRWICILAGLSLISFLSLLFYPQYKIVGEELLSNAHFNSGLTSWNLSDAPERITHSHSHNTVSLEQTATYQNTYLRQSIKGDDLSGSYLLSGQLRVQGLLAGKEAWQKGALLLIRKDTKGQRIASYSVTSLEGETAWSSYQQFITLPVPTTDITVELRMLKSVGQLQAQSISLLPASKQAYYSSLRLIIIMAWALFALLLIRSLLQAQNAKLPLLLISIIATLALIGTLMPREAVIALDAQIMNTAPRALTHFVKNVFDTFLPGYITHANQEISKFGHWLVFFIMALLSFIYFRKSSILLILTGLLVLAFATETLQLLTSERTPHLKDIAIDSAGVIMGMILAVPLRIIKNTRQ
jgi:VanZ family protein